MIKMKKLIAEAGKHGFDLTDFKPGGFQKVLRGMGEGKPKMKKGNRSYPSFEFTFSNVTIVTGNDPITGGPRGEKDYASYIGIEGEPEAVAKVVALIKQHSSYTKDESPGRRDFI